MAARDFVRQLPWRTGHSLAAKNNFWNKVHLDWQLLLLLLILVSFGLVVLYSASDRDMDMVYRQLTRIGVAFVFMLVFAQIGPHHYRRWSPWLYLAGVMMLVAVIFVGVGAKGAQRWLEIPGVTRFQPSEMMKLALPMVLAWFFADHHLPPRVKHLFVGVLVIAVPTLLIAKQPDLGTAILIAASGCFIILYTGLRWRIIIALGMLAAAAVPLVWPLLKDYQKGRIMTFLDPERDRLGAGWNTIQAKTAIGSGGVDGKGWLEGTQSHLNFLPESHTDFIIAVFAEEFGFIGVVLLLALYFMIVSRCMVIAAQADDTYSRLLAGSLSLTFFFYVFVNIGMVSGILPVVGVPLPLVSYGGTSIVTLCVGFGILMSIQTHKKLLPK